MGWGPEANPTPPFFTCILMFRGDKHVTLPNGWFDKMSEIAFLVLNDCDSQFTSSSQKRTPPFFRPEKHWLPQCVLNKKHYT